MPLHTDNRLFDPNTLHRDILDPRIVKNLVFDGGTDFKGAKETLMANFRFKELLSATDRARSNIARLTSVSREELACVLFDILGQILKRYSCKYDYTEVASVFAPEQAVDGMIISCMSCTASLGSLLYCFGFDPAKLYKQVSNMSNNNAVKVLIKQTLDPATVKGYQGRNTAVAYDAATMAPIKDEVTNGFKLQSSPNGAQTVKMVPRDPFLNHYTLFVDDGFVFPHFDALLGARYKTGQGDAFSGYQRWHTGGFQYRGQEVEVFKHGENEKARLYSVPDNLTFTNADYITAHAKYSSKGLKLWIVIDAEDWLPVQRVRPAAPPAWVPGVLGRAKPAVVIGAARANSVTHPPSIHQLFNLA